MRKMVLVAWLQSTSWCPPLKAMVTLLIYFKEREHDPRMKVFLVGVSISSVFIVLPALRCLAWLSAALYEEWARAILEASLKKKVEEHNTKGQYADAISSAIQLRDLCVERVGKMHKDYAAELNNLGVLHLAIRDLARAKTLFAEAREIYGEVLSRSHPSYATSLSNLAQVAQAEEDFDESCKLTLEALVIREKALGRTRLETATSLYNLAAAYCSKGDGDLAEAETLIVEACKIWENVLGRKHPHYASGLGLLAIICLGKRDLERGHTLQSECLEILEAALGRKHPLVATSLSNLASFKVACGDLQEGFALTEEACAIHAELLFKTLPALAPSQRLHMIHSVESSLSGMRSLAARLCSGGFPEETMTAVKLASFKAAALRKNLLFDCEAADSELAQLALDCKEKVLAAELNDLDRQVKAARARLAESLIGHPEAQQITLLLEELERLERRAAEKLMEGSGSSSIRELRRLHNMGSANFLQELGQLLPKNSALVEYVNLGSGPKKAEAARTYGAFVLSKRGEGLQRLQLHLLVLGSGPEVDRDLGSFLPLLESWASPTTVVQAGLAAGHRLRQRLLDKPLELVDRHLGRKPEHLFLCPDGELFRLPFVALPASSSPMDKASGPYVLDEPYSISYLTAGRDLFRLSKMPQQQGLPTTLRLFFKPDFAAKPELPSSQTPTREVGFFTELPATGKEGEALKKLFEDKGIAVQSFSGDEATCRELLATSSPSFLHIATHGFSESYEPADGPKIPKGFERVTVLRAVPEPLLRCGLAMAGAQTWQKSEEKCGSGIVSGLELRNLDLKGTVLVTLSACETGVGQVQTGQGLACLGRVVLLAGAETAVVTSGRVADESTKDLMVAFYTELLEESGCPFHRARALRQAQHEVRGRKYRVGQARSVNGDHPMWWAPFLLFGATGPLPAIIPKAE